MLGSRQMISGYVPKPVATLLAVAAFAMAGVSAANSQSLSESTMSLRALHWPAAGDVRVIALEQVFADIATLREVGVSELAWAADRRYASLTIDGDLSSAGGSFRLIEHVQLAQGEFSQTVPGAGTATPFGVGSAALSNFGSVNNYNSGGFGQIVLLYAGTQPLISATPTTGFSFLDSGNGEIQLGGDVPPPTITFDTEIYDPGKSPTAATGCEGDECGSGTTIVIEADENGVIHLPPVIASGAAFVRTIEEIPSDVSGGAYAEYSDGTIIEIGALDWVVEPRQIHIEPDENGVIHLPPVIASGAIFVRTIEEIPSDVSGGEYAEYSDGTIIEIGTLDWVVATAAVTPEPSDIDIDLPTTTATGCEGDECGSGTFTPLPTTTATGCEGDECGSGTFTPLPVTTATGCEGDECGSGTFTPPQIESVIPELAGSAASEPWLGTDEGRAFEFATQQITLIVDPQNLSEGVYDEFFEKYYSFALADIKESEAGDGESATGEIVDLNIPPIGESNDSPEPDWPSDPPLPPLEYDTQVSVSIWLERMTRVIAGLDPRYEYRDARQDLLQGPFGDAIRRDFLKPDADPSIVGLQSPTQPPVESVLPELAAVGGAPDAESVGTQPAVSPDTGSSETPAPPSPSAGDTLQARAVPIPADHYEEPSTESTDNPFDMLIRLLAGLSPSEIPTDPRDDFNYPGRQSAILATYTIASVAPARAGGAPLLDQARAEILAAPIVSGAYNPGIIPGDANSPLGPDDTALFGVGIGGIINQNFLFAAATGTPSIGSTIPPCSGSSCGGGGGPVTPPLVLPATINGFAVNQVLSFNPGSGDGIFFQINGPGSVFISGSATPASLVQVPMNVGTTTFLFFTLLVASDLEASIRPFGGQAGEFINFVGMPDSSGETLTFNAAVAP